MRTFFFLFPALLVLSACGGSGAPSGEETSQAADTLRYEAEHHLVNMHQLTFGGDNAEGYFSFDGQQIVFQATNPAWEVPCDQIFVMPLSGTEGQKPPMLSTGKGRTTCSYFLPGDSTILYASTHLAADTCPEAPRAYQGKYVWAVHPEYDIFVADMKGNVLRQLTNEPGYDAEATLSPDGSQIVFTSTRSGDLELWTMNTDGSNVKQVTNELGYDGGAFFSPDGKKLVFRASRPKAEEEVKTYKELLANGLVQPINMEIFVCNVDGSDLKQITHLGGASWAPYFYPNGEKVIFSSNHHTESGRVFNLFSIDLNGENLEQITFDPTFDAFPMFSPDGKKLIFASNRNNGDTRDTNLFLADWESQ
ncbi:MAG: PD40 domain-containing protein [Saprospirales bacterium]|nr:PD40 domain-containing protein [Saprospirales bacterium]